MFKWLCLVLTTLLHISALSAAADRPNVILITISSLRYDHIQYFSYKRDTSDNFDIFAANSAVFTNAFSTSGWMMPSTGSIFTSLMPSAHQATHISKKLCPSAETIAEILQKNGYRTAGFCCNPRLSSEYGFAQGFELYDDFTVGIILETMTFGKGSVNINQSRTNNIINSSAMRWLAENKDKRFFLFLHYYDNHWDYLPPPPYDSIYDPDYTGPVDGKNIAREPLYSNMPQYKDLEHMIALYDGQIKLTDNDLGKFIAYLKKQSCYKNTMIIIMADHGEAFYEHSHTSHHGLYPELTHIPLAIRLPDTAGKHIVSSELVSVLDIMPTILDYADINIPQQCIGKSLRPVLSGQKDKFRQYIPMQYSGGAVEDCAAVRTEKYKFVKTSQCLFCYDLLKDENQLYPIAFEKFSSEEVIEYDKIKDLLNSISQTVIQDK